jgi:WD40 repeat protein
VNSKLVPSFQTRLTKPVAGLYLVPETKGRVLILFTDGQLASYQIKDNKVIFERNITSLGPVYGRTQMTAYDKSLFVSGSGTLYNIANWQSNPAVLRYANVTAFDVSESKTCVWVKDNKIQTFKSLAEIGKAPLSDVQMVGIATTASMSPDGKQYIVGTYSGKLILGTVGKNATHFAENSTDYPRVHLSAISKVRWVESLNGEASLITSSFDHTVKLTKLSDFLENRYASELVRLDVHNAWIFGFVWVPSKQGIITYSEDKRVVFSLLSSNELFNSLVK